MAIDTLKTKQGENFFQRLLNRNSLLFALTFVVIPNLPFFLATFIFVPERLLVVPFYFAAGMLALFLPRWIGPVLFFGVAAFDLLVLVCRAFFLGPALAIQALAYLKNINPQQSLFYVSVVLIMLAIATLMSFITWRYRSNLRSASPTLGFLLLIAFMLFDGRVNHTWSMFGQFNTPPAAFDSARSQNSVTADSVAARGTNLFLVIVEGLGAQANPVSKALLSKHFQGQPLLDRFDVTFGTSNYFGSTTGAESRELCGRWGDYRDYLSSPVYPTCLPNQMKALGYETTSFHGFTPDMFSRGDWHPHIGFQKLEFENELLAAYPDAFPHRCGSLFKGLCDTEIAAAVKGELTKADGKKRFVYWLTLNTHVPFVAKENSAMKCGTPESEIANKTVCQLTELWSDLFEQISVIAADPNLPPTDILIVGDHNTPLFARAARDNFTHGKVAWYYLKDRRGKAQ